jgi:hypothetical protein
MSDVVINVADTPVPSIEVSVTDTPIPVVTVNVSGTKGDTGPSGPPGGSPPSQEVTTNGMIGTAPIPVTGYSSGTEYQVLLSYAEDPGGNSAPWAVKSAGSFIIKHHGINYVKCSYLVTPTI